MKGLFITFEGPEGSGKTTHIELLAAHLRSCGRTALITREPGGTQLSENIREILLHTREAISPLAELFLYESDRAQHVTETVQPALIRGEIVLCDRYVDSTVAYQGYGRKLPMPMIETLNKIASAGLAPDLTILLDISAAQGLRQAGHSKLGHDRLEKAGIAFHNRVRNGFLKLARQNPGRFRLIRQQKDINHTQKLIQETVDAFLNGAKA
jgi:dTMP kinase